MKKIVFVAIADIFFCLSLYAQEANRFYYYQGEKIYLQPRTDKVFLKFTHSLKKEQLQALINNDASIQLASTVNLDDDFFDSVILEVKESRQPSSIIESYKTKDEIISITPILQYNKTLQGLTDEFVIKIKEGTSYEQMLALAEKNHCKMGKENEFVKNQFMIYVSKTSQLDALQMSNLFYETGLFEFSEPNFTILNAFQSHDTYFNQQWTLKNTGQNGGKVGVDIKAEQTWGITQGNPSIKIAVIDQGVDLTHPDLQANLYTTDMQGSAGKNVASGVTGDYYANFCGTSAACPHVAGVAALILSAKPDLMQAQVRQIIESTCTKLSGYSYSNNSDHPNGTWNEQVGYGLVDAYAAVSSVAAHISGPSTVCYNDSSAFTLNNPPAGTITWSVTGPFAVSGNGVTAKVVRTGTDNTNGTLTVYVNGSAIATKTITPCISTISGPSTVCPGGTATFTASNVPAGYTWGYSSNLTPIPGNPGSFKASSSPGSAWVSVRQGPVEMARRNFSIYTTLSITGPSTIYPVTPSVFYSNSPCAVSYKWELATVDPSTLVMGTPVVVGANYTIGIQTGSPQSATPKHYLLRLTVQDRFGNSQSTMTAFSIYGEPVIDPNGPPNGRNLPVSPISVNVFPYPVSDTLHIEIDAPTGVATQAATSCEIFLYDDQGTLVWRQKTQDSKVLLDVSGFPNGFYDLVIYDEVNGKFDKRQIVVKN